MINGKKNFYTLLNEGAVDFFCCIYIINRIIHLLVFFILIQRRKSPNEK